jgi:hypothetical protein
MPKHIKTDIFVWLYLSLFVHINKQAGKEMENYAEDEKKQVKRVIKEKFSNVIDDIMLEKIINYVEKDYVLRDETVSRTERRKILDPKVFQYIDSFDDLFSNNLQIGHIYQDAITGGIVPIFEDMPYLQDSQKDQYVRLNVLISREPSPKRIKAAYRNYLKLLKNSNDEEIVNDAIFNDPEAEVDFYPVENNVKIDELMETKQIIDDDNFYIKYIDSVQKGTLFNYEIDIFSENGRVQVSTPFDKNKTSNWMNKRFQRACNICPELAELLKKEQIIPQEKQETEGLEKEIIYKGGVADQLDVCGAVYRLVESVIIPNHDIKNIKNVSEDLKHSLIKIDKYFTGKSDSYFQQMGIYLECLAAPLIDYSDKEKRQKVTEDFFKSQIKAVCSKMHIKWDFLMRGKDIFREWQMARNHYKADVLNIVISNQYFPRCNSLYYEFIEDAFNLYNLRNQYGHYSGNKNPIDTNYKREHIEMLYKVSKVFLDLLKNKGVYLL